MKFIEFISFTAGYEWRKKESPLFIHCIIVYAQRQRTQKVKLLYLTKIKPLLAERSNTFNTNRIK